MVLATIPNAEVSRATNRATVNSAQGRDYSSFQRPVSAGDLQGLSFAYTRISDWTNYPNMGVDVNAQRNWAEMKSFGLHRGAYWYFYPELDPVQQARFFFNTVKSFGLLNGDMLVCDMEELPSGVDLNRNTKTFLVELDSLCQASNIFAITEVYTNHNVGQHLTSCTKWPLWFAWPNSIAPPADLIAPWTDWTFWQWGAVGGVDADAFNGTSTDLNAWVVNHVPAPVGPYRHVADGTRSLYGTCKDRHESMDEVINTTLTSTQISPTHLAEFNSYIRQPMPAGLVYYTQTP